MAPSDAAGKTRHCVLMMFAAAVTAGLAPEQLEQRLLGRYVFLWGDAFLEWARRWRNHVARSHDREVVRTAVSAKRLCSDFERVLDASGGIRDFLAAKRQPLAALRADDMDATVLRWAYITAESTNDLLARAIEIHDLLASTELTPQSALAFVGLPFSTQGRLTAALSVREPYWYAAADTSAGLRPHTLPIAQGGEVGRTIAQINDVATHIDCLVAIAPVLWGRFPYDWFIRSSIVLEVAALLDLAVGSPPRARSHGRPNLMDLCHYGRAPEAAAELARMRDSIAAQTRDYLRWCRDKFCAHLDLRLSLTALHQHLGQLDAHGNIWLAQHLLTWLDDVARSHQEVQLLLFGERRIGSWPLVPTSGDEIKAPDPASIPASLSNLFRSIDSPYAIGTGGSAGTGVVAGLLASRSPRPRERLRLPPRESRFLEPRAGVRYTL